MGRGRFLGTNICVVAAPEYCDTWFGEGEVKIYLDNDTEFPTLCGTGTEDYIGSGWGQDFFYNRYQGSLYFPQEGDSLRKYAFYRYHVPDPVYFDKECRVTIQQLGSSLTSDAVELMKNGANLIPVTIVDDQFGENMEFYRLLEMDDPPDVTDPTYAETGMVFYRSDDWSATAYFYLDKPFNELPVLALVDKRIKEILY